jgi:N-acetylneuraminate synthase
MSAKTITVGNRTIGPGHPSYIIAEIGINHNGSVDLARKLIDAAVESGCDAVKFQKRTVDVVYSAAELERPRESPFGRTNGDLKHGLELGESDYHAIDDYCRQKSIDWFASCWDEASVDFVARFRPPCFKIASASLTDTRLLRHHRRHKVPILLSTGMSTLEQIDEAVDALGSNDLVLLHTTSTYPSQVEELNLRVIEILKNRYGVPVGYSGHEVGLAPSIGAVALGACVIERHITLDRAMWGSDHAASVEPAGFRRLVKDIRALEASLGDGVKRIWESEVAIMQKLRRVGL